MRCLLCMLAVLTVVGCRSNSTTLSNPFMSPDRVPPPVTRTPLPGTAQPYYGSHALPASPAISTPMPQTAPQPLQTTPPSGWNTPPASAYPPASSSYNVNPTSAEIPVVQPVVATEPPVQIVADQQGLRFGSPSPPSFAAVQPTYAPTAPPLNSIPTAMNAPTMQVDPRQAYAVQPAEFQMAVAQPQYVEPTAPEVTVRPVHLRAISSDEPSRTSGISRDGFRPQGSAVRRESRRVVAAAAHEPPERFGAGPQHQWLRGRLEQTSSGGPWKLRYVAAQEMPDRLGGSVLIANPRVLGNLRSGEYVVLRGRLGDPANRRSMAPSYKISAVQRQQR